MNFRDSAAYQNAIREQKLAAEISAAKRERDFYMGQVDKAKCMEAMKERKRKVRPEKHAKMVDYGRNKQSASLWVLFCINRGQRATQYHALEVMSRSYCPCTKFCFARSMAADTISEAC